MSTPATHFALDAAGEAAIAARHARYFQANPATRAKVALTLALIVGLAVFAVYQMHIDWIRVVNGFGRLGEFASVMLPPSYGNTEQLLVYLHALGETVAIAFLGVFTAAILALPFGFLAAKNVVPEIVIHFLTRRFFDSVRGVDKLIWALIWINVVGLGPFAGVLAIMTSEFGLLAKLFSEAIETADRKPVEGILASGGSQVEAVRFGLLPSVIPVILGNMLYQFESNTRSATIIGVVGAGGIGRYFYEMIKVNEWQIVCFLVIIVWIAVSAIDFVSARVRSAIIGKAGH